MSDRAKIGVDVYPQHGLGSHGWVVAGAQLVACERFEAATVFWCLKTRERLRAHIENKKLNVFRFHEL